MTSVTGFMIALRRMFIILKQTTPIIYKTNYTKRISDITLNCSCQISVSKRLQAMATVVSTA